MNCWNVANCGGWPKCKARHADPSMNDPKRSAPKSLLRSKEICPFCKYETTSNEEMQKHYALECHWVEEGLNVIMEKKTTAAMEDEGSTNSKRRRTQTKRGMLYSQTKTKARSKNPAKR